MRPGVGVLAAVLLASLVPSVGWAEEGLTAEDRREIAWLEGTGHAVGDGRPLVRMITSPKDSGAIHWTPSSLGFLLEETDETWVVLGAEPEGVPVAKRPRIADDERHTMQIIDAATFGTAYLRNFESGDAEDGDRGLRLLREMFSGPALGPQTEAILVARTVATRGEPALAHRILKAARRALRTRDDPRVPATLQEGAAAELALMRFWRILLRFDDGKVPYDVLREDLVAFLRAFPASEHAPAAKDVLRILERMLGEGAAHPVLDASAIAALPPEEQVREWIFLLRDQDGGQWMQPGSPSVFLNEGMKEDTPAHHLVRLGRHAIPALIEILTDERFTRTVGYWRNFHFSHYVVRYGDAALEILQRVTGVYCWKGTYTNASMFKDGQAAEVQREYRVWWAEVGAFEEPLASLVAAPLGELAARAQALPERDPGRLATLGPKALWGTAAVWEKLGVARERAVELSTAVLQHSAHARLRVAAAWMLRDLRAPGGVEAMAALWARLDEDARIDPSCGEHVAAFLAACGDPQAVRALCEGL